MLLNNPVLCSVFCQPGRIQTPTLHSLGLIKIEEVQKQQQGLSQMEPFR